MDTRCGTLASEALTEDSVKRKLYIYEPSNRRMEPGLFRAPIWKRAEKKSRRSLDFGETDPSVQLHCPDLLPNRFDLNSLIMRSSGDRIIFTADQKATLEAVFRKQKYPDQKQKATLAAKLDVNITKVQLKLSRNRVRDREVQLPGSVIVAKNAEKSRKKGAVGPSGYRPILPGVSLIQTSCKRSVKSTVGFGCFPQFPEQLPVTSQPLQSTPFLANVPFTSASHHVTQSFAAEAQLYPQQPDPVSRPPAVAETGPLPYQQLNTPFHQVAAADSRCLSDEFPFCYSIAKELPHIFGNLEDDEVLDRPLTPSFGPLTVSCCFDGNEMLWSPPPIGELSCGLMYKGRSFRFFRQE
ncbi:hypothetical protein OS493_027876 [Desmophyllum pertusum]|uniref:Homeobox domain-containing protein n=1 Tax=Desmophyllum pertusum TaxID=174260 RepID=A0A9W9YNI1_9CNID|nr:hypothetical protein OS493_027876 [Desmophyllum pertusum]